MIQTIYKTFGSWVVQYFSKDGYAEIQEYITNILVQESFLCMSVKKKDDTMNKPFIKHLVHTFQKMDLQRFKNINKQFG
jgi:hypothetical protein